MGICASWMRASAAEDRPDAPQALTDPIEVVVQDLPADDSCTFLDNGILLPSPTDVCARAVQEGEDVNSTYRPNPVRFPELGLIVKWGEEVSIAEGQCLWFMNRHLKERVPVPRIYGWARDGNLTFLYMELIHGDTLADGWSELKNSEKRNICDQLNRMVASWRRILKPCGAEFQLSQIGDQGLRDIMFEHASEYPAGPFLSVAAFHDFFAGVVDHATPRQEIEELAGFTDDTAVVFTHADLHPSNILISKAGEGPLRIVAIMDWHQSGWYPEHWEVLKAKTVGDSQSDWVRKYLDTVLTPAKFEYYYAWEYIMSTGVCL